MNFKFLQLIINVHQKCTRKISIIYFAHWWWWLFFNKSPEQKLRFQWRFQSWGKIGRTCWIQTWRPQRQDLRASEKCTNSYLVHFLYSGGTLKSFTHSQNVTKNDRENGHAEAYDDGSNTTQSYVGPFWFIASDNIHQGCFGHVVVLKYCKIKKRNVKQINHTEHTWNIQYAL